MATGATCNTSVSPRTAADATTCRVEVAEVGERATIVARAAGVRGRQPLAIFAGGVERDQLDVGVLRALEREFGAA